MLLSAGVSTELLLGPAGPAPITLQQTWGTLSALYLQQLVLLMFTQHSVPAALLRLHFSSPRPKKGHGEPQETPQNPRGCLFYQCLAQISSLGSAFTWIVCPKRRTAPFLTGEIRLAREVTRAKGRTRFVLGSCEESTEQIVLAVPPSEISQAASKKHKPT